MSSITIRRVDSANISDVVPGIVSVFRDDEVVPWYRYDECLAWVTVRTARGFYITTAYYDEKLAGYSEWIPTYDNGKAILYLGVMHVDCELRGRRIGKAMLDDGAEYAKSIGATCLRTIPEDDRALDFYRKFGFVETDSIYRACLPTTGSISARNEGAPLPTAEIADTHEFVFGLCQSSGRHMFEVANHNPDSDFKTIAPCIPGGYLQFRYRSETKTALALYWSNVEATADTVSAILAAGKAAGFNEVEFYFKSKHMRLFAGQKTSQESTEIERKII